MLRMHEVIKQFGQRKFGPFTLQIANAETIAILGPNGVGKSTLLKLLAGAYQPSSGLVRFNGLALGSWAADMLSQHRAVLSQSQNLAFALKTELVISLGRVSTHQDADCLHVVESAAALLGVTHLLKQSVDTLSGGELARVQLARVCAQLWDVEDGFILMDEPIAAVDPGKQDLILETLLSFALARRHAVIAVLHDLNHALRYFQRLMLIHTDGQLEFVQSGPEAKHALERLYDVRLSCLQDEQGDWVMTPLRKKSAGVMLC